LLTDGRSPDGSERWLTWILVGREEPRPLGFVQATVAEPEAVHVAYVIGRAHWRKGYAREAISAMLDTVFDRYEVARAIAEMDARNAASIGLARALGFVHVRTERDVLQRSGGPCDEHVYEVDREAWRAGRADGR
jgi:RimJ/RimL family protein N-acetyltransferase